MNQLTHARRQFALAKNDKERVYWSHVIGRYLGLQKAIEHDRAGTMGEFKSLTVVGVKAELKAAERRKDTSAVRNCKLVLEIFQAWSEGDIGKVKV